MSGRMDGESLGHKCVMDCEECGNGLDDFDELVGALVDCCSVIGTIEDDDHWKARDRARRWLIKRGMTDPWADLGDPR